MTNQRPTIVITSGEPSGVGIEVTLKALQQAHDANIVVLGDAHWISDVNQQGQLGNTITVIEDLSQLQAHQPGQIQVLHSELSEPATLGQPSPQNAEYVINLLQQAHNLAYNKQIDAIVTAPVHKGIINDANIPFTGHTEFFAQQSQCDKVVMMLASDVMNVALVTTHLPLNKVAGAIDQATLHQVLDIIVDGLQQLNIKQPNIKVLGLNPHAGEQGHLGTEELTTIIPALNAYKTKQAVITGPYPADTAFSKANLADTDLFLAMYHDQGLPVIKYASFGECANVTLGLPYIRTSVDHGTALDIAKDFNASGSSMDYAIRFALQSIQRNH
ncbi:4-hydroxythreonine-4-phosphate dehydrogenase PdxA [Pleionea mediterranea]|uniref:4-hydroxythreonine-4-phosphate dehydrogenase n=1 Tax=Pleionea mediterranea TaxID=523701 RepID=A0A316G1P1_9GAMM|nr:4-hydroxythreonine-4-phosphate dehydrogenase PdxA [Pleionea mediterranea]PWK53816.1 4-hydroxythreonine-4-phosphate dehydrogenase [Pleionea mediterranea]